MAAIYIYEGDVSPDVLDRLDAIEAALTDLAAAVRQQAANTTTQSLLLEESMSDISARIAAGVSAIEAQTTVIGSVTTLLDGLHGDVSNLRNQLAASGVSEGDLAQLDAMVNSINANKSTLAAAVARNTDADAEVGAGDLTGTDTTPPADTGTDTGTGGTTGGGTTGGSEEPASPPFA
jgi:hypothetical protein